MIFNRDKEEGMLSIIWSAMTDKTTMGFGGFALFLSGISGTWLLGILGPLVLTILGVIKHYNDIKLSRTRLKEAEARLEKEKLQLQILKDNTEAEIQKRAEEILKKMEKDE